MEATVKESGIILDPKQFLEWGHQQLKKIEQERLYKSPKVVMVCIQEKGKNIKIDGDFMNDSYDDYQDTVKKKKKKKKELETISSINIELNKQTKQSKKEKTKKRKRSGCVYEVEESELSSKKKGGDRKKKKMKAQAEDSNDKRKTKKGRKGTPIKAEVSESDLPSKKKKRQTSIDRDETERPKKKKRKIAEDSPPCDASTAKRKNKKKKQDTTTYLYHSDGEHEFTSSSKKEKKNTQHLETQPNEDVHSEYTDHAESNLFKHKKKKKKKKKKRENVNEVEIEEDRQLLETKRRKETKLEEIVELDYSNDTYVKKKKKKKKKEDSEASHNTCSSLSHKWKKSKEAGFENSDSIHEKKKINSEVDERVVSSKRSKQAHCCGHCPHSSGPGFGKSPISRLLSKNMTCDICPGKLYRQELEDVPSASKTPVIIKQERMEDWVGYNIEKELDASVRVKKEPEEQPVNAAPSLTIKTEKTDNRDVQEKQTGNEQHVAEMCAVWIKEERVEASQENDNIRPAENVVEEVGEALGHVPSNCNTNLDNNIEDDNSNNNNNNNNSNNDDYNINTTGTESNVLQSDEVDSSTYKNFYDDKFTFKDEFVNFTIDEIGDQTAVDPLQEAGNTDNDYLQCVISQNSFGGSDRTMLQCTISAQDERRQVTALDVENEMLHFMNVFPKFRDRLHVSRLLKVPIKRTYFHHYVVDTRELMDVYVQFKSQQDLKTAMQFYARRVRCEQWCVVQERSLPQEIENDPDANKVQNMYQWYSEGYKKPLSQNRNVPRQQQKRHYQRRHREQNSRQVNWKGSGAVRRRWC